MLDFSPLLTDMPSAQQFMGGAGAPGGGAGAGAGAGRGAGQQ